MIDFSEDYLRALFPFVQRPAMGETSLLDRLTPWLSWASDSFATLYLAGPDTWDVLDAACQEAVRRCLALKAMERALPGLDTVLTATGVGVVSTNSLAPASADRVRALREAVGRDADRALADAVEALRRSYDAWETLPAARFWGEVPVIFDPETETFTEYLACRQAWGDATRALVSEVTGPHVMEAMASGRSGVRLHRLISEVVRRSASMPGCVPADRDVARVAEALRTLGQSHHIYRLWAESPAGQRWTDPVRFINRRDAPAFWT